MDKVQTNVLIEKELKKFAKDNKISMSACLNEALRIKMGLPEDKNLIIEEKKSLQSRLNWINSAEAKVLCEIENAKLIQQKQEQLKDIDIIRKAFVIKCQTNNAFSETYNRILRAFCKKYNMDMATAVNLSQTTKKGV